MGRLDVVTLVVTIRSGVVVVSAIVRVVVPAGQVGGITHTALSLYVAKAESLHVAADGSVRAHDASSGAADRERREEMFEHRRELLLLDDLLCQLDWKLDPADVAVELVGPPGLIRELIYGTLYDTIERLPGICHAYEHERASLTALEHAIRGAMEAFELFAGFEKSDGDGS